MLKQPYHRLFGVPLLAASMGVLATPAVTQSYPSDMIRIVTSGPAGTPPDIITRIVANELGQSEGGGLHRHDVAEGKLESLAFVACEGFPRLDRFSLVLELQPEARRPTSRLSDARQVCDRIWTHTQMLDTLTLGVLLEPRDAGAHEHNRMTVLLKMAGDDHGPVVRAALMRRTNQHATRSRHG